MDEFLQVYKKTWFFWVFVLIGVIVLAEKTEKLFYGLIPILLGYSLYFAYVRGGELRAERELEERKADEQKRQSQNP